MEVVEDLESSRRTRNSDEIHVWNSAGRRGEGVVLHGSGGLKSLLGCFGVRSLASDVPFLEFL